MTDMPNEIERGDLEPTLPDADDSDAKLHEMMLLDLAVLGYYHTLRVQGWIGDLALHIEHEFFGQDALAENGRRPVRRPGRFSVEEDVRRLSEQFMPLLDRANRMVIRNLKAIKELRQGLVPAIAIGRAEQVTVTNQQNGRVRRNGIPSGTRSALAPRRQGGARRARRMKRRA